MDVYAEEILDHYRQPRGKQPLPSPSITHEEVNLSCGDAITLQLTITEGTITHVGWNGNGCAISQAAMSMLSEELAGKYVKEAELLIPQNIYGLLGVPIGPRRTKCALLSLHVLKNALHLHRKEPVQGWSETAATAI